MAINRTIRVCVVTIVMSVCLVTSVIGETLHSSLNGEGTIVLWDQPLSVTDHWSVLSQDYSNYPNSSTYMLDDFISSDWSITSIFIPGGGKYGFTTLDNAEALTWQIYADNSGVPLGYPGGNSLPFWTLTLAPNDDQVSITTGSEGYTSNITLNLATPIQLPSGHWWLLFYPTMASGYGDYGRQPSDTSNGYITQYINPGGALGFGTTWQPMSVLGLSKYDLAFRIEGTRIEYQAALPFVVNPLKAPTLLAISNPLKIGSYTVSWTETPTRWANSYTLQEASNSSFTLNLRTVCTTSTQSCNVIEKTGGTWYYRVRGNLPTGNSVWSNTVSTYVCGNIPYNETLRWNMEKINAPGAWACTQGGSGVIIAIIDSGIDTDHPDLASNLVGGATFVDGTSNWEDDNGHGTHVAGIAAGVANNGGIVGVAPRAKIMPVKVVDSEGYGYISWEAAGIIWAVNHGAKVINLSLGAYVANDVEFEAIRYAYENGIPIAAAAGNDATYAYLYPAAYGECLAVVATTQTDTDAWFSNYGNWIDVSAPGVDIYSSIPNGYGIKNGTSMASPHVAGLLALIVNLKPSWTVPQIYNHIFYSSVDDIGSTGFDLLTGFGRINVQKAINNALSVPWGFEPVSIVVDEHRVAFRQDPTEFRPGAVMFKLRDGASIASLSEDVRIQAAGLQVVAAIEAIQVLELQVPVGEEIQWLAYLRSLPEVEYAELDGLVRIQ